MCIGPCAPSRGYVGAVPKDKYPSCLISICRSCSPRDRHKSFKASVEIVIRPLSNSTAILRLAKMREFSCEQACPQTVEARCDQISPPP